MKPKIILIVLMFINLPLTYGQIFISAREFLLSPKSAFIPDVNKISFVKIQDPWISSESLEFFYSRIGIKYSQWHTGEPIQETTLSSPAGTGKEVEFGGKSGQFKFVLPVFKNFFLGAGVEISKDDVTGEIYIYDFFGKYNFGNLNFMASASLKDLKNFYNSRIIITYAAKSSVEIIFAGNFDKAENKITENLGIEFSIFQPAKMRFSYITPTRILSTNLQLQYKKLIFDVGISYHILAQFNITRLSGTFRF